MTRSALLAIAAATAACAPAARNESGVAVRNEAAPPRAEVREPAYVIRGEPRPNWTPGWAAVMFGNRLLLDSPTSAGWYASVLPAPASEGRRRIYATERLTVAIEPGACTLREYYPGLPDRVTLDWDSGSFEGCGGPRRPAGEIAGTVWELVRIGDDAAPALRSPVTTLIFGRDGGLGGTLSCNDGGIRRRWTRSGFEGSAAGFEQTAMGCNDPAGEAFGMRFWSGMMTARAWRRDGERLFVTFADGTEAELRYLL